MSTIIDRILDEVCLDERIPDGVFDMENNAHMEVLRENLSDNYGLELNDVKDIHNKMLEGKYPERQAYNKDGLLVTFPTPQHKQRAIQRGTHFEQDPTKGAPNVFGGQAAPGAQQPAQQPSQPPPAPEPKAEPKAEPQAAPKEPAPSAGSSLPPSDSQPSAPAQPSGPVAGKSSPSNLPASDQPAQAPAPSPLAVEPPAASQAPAPPPNFETPKPPQTRSAEAQVVKQMMGGDNDNNVQPTLAEKRYIELNRVFNFAKQMGYTEAMSVLSEAMNH